MKHPKLLSLLFLLSIGCLSGNIAAQQAGGAPDPYRGNWSGHWSSGNDYLYIAEMRLNAASDGTVEGEINWTLSMSPREQDVKKIGMTAIEFVKGTYDPANRILSLEGHNKNDPNEVIGLDKYRLILAENGAALGGITWDHGSWRGLFGLSRKQD